MFTSSRLSQLGEAKLSSNVTKRLRRGGSMEGQWDKESERGVTCRQQIEPISKGVFRGKYLKTQLEMISTIRKFYLT